MTSNANLPPDFDDLIDDEDAALSRALVEADPAAGSTSWREDPSFSYEGLLWLGQQLGAAGLTTRRLLGREVIRLAQHFLKEGVKAPHRDGVMDLLDLLDISSGQWSHGLEPLDLPAVALVPEIGYAFVYAIRGQADWIVETKNGRERRSAWPKGTLFLPVSTRREEDVPRTAAALFDKIMSADRGWIPLAAVATTLASILVLGTSLYSMQVYDRVIGQGGTSTLIVLTVGVIIAILIELGLKVARSAIMDRAINRIDLEASVAVYARLMAVRVDQLPASLGTLAAQVRGFETVRAFRVARAIYLATDLPFALFFLLIIGLIGGVAVALVPMIAFAISVAGGLSLRRAIEIHSTREVSVANRRHGILVETIQSAESVKASGANWLLQGRWNALSRESADESMKIKHLNDMAGYFSGFVQQISYIFLVAVGAYLAVTSKSLTTGGIIACSILSGRVLTPVAALPGLLVQWANAKVALDNLEKLYELESDNHGVDQPLSPETAHGRLELRHVAFSWPGQSTPLSIKSLLIQPGERVGIIGSVGSGKSTLLKLFAGMIKPSEGVVCLDGMDVQHISAERRAELIGYLPQTTRLLSGTLRQNLTLGLPYIAEEQLMSVLRATGLAEQIAHRPEGLDVRISEGGEGLSGGQKQLVSMSRLLLCPSRLWLLDEPTSSMDEMTEERCLAALKGHIKPGQTLLLVTHKARLLDLVERLIVLTPHGIALDGPKAQVLAALRQAQTGASNPPRNIAGAVHAGRTSGANS